jgi:hypothetical protein
MCRCRLAFSTAPPWWFWAGVCHASLTPSAKTVSPPSANSQNATPILTATNPSLPPSPSRRLRNSGAVSDLRQSRRLVRGGAAQSRLALRAVVLRLASFQRRGLWCAHPTSVRRANPLAATPAGRKSQPLPVPGSALSCSMLPPSTTTTSAGAIPGIVKLWEPPRHSRGVSRSSSDLLGENTHRNIARHTQMHPPSKRFG